MNSFCRTYQQSVNCVTEKAGDCPLLILMIHAMSKSLGQQMDCTIEVSKPYPTIPASFQDPNTKDNAGKNQGILQVLGGIQGSVSVCKLMECNCISQRQ